MAVRLKKLKDQVIVIAGASSGIGLVTARKAAQRGAKLVLAARNEDALQELAEEIRAQGGESVPVSADVGSEEAVRAIATAALEAFGGFDSWINNAGIGMYGRMMDIPIEDARKLFETNYWGLVHGSLEAARHLRHKTGRYGGAIINIGSEVSDRAVVLLGMYSASKHAVKGFTDALRMELELDEAPISVSLVKPGATNTPFPEHAQNYMEEEPTLPEPIYAPEVVADVILHCAETPERDMFAAGSAKWNSMQSGLMPRLTDFAMEMLFPQKQKSGKPPQPKDDALYRPTTGLRERGEFQGHTRESSVYTKAAMHPLLSVGLVVGAGLLAATAILRTR